MGEDRGKRTKGKRRGGERWKVEEKASIRGNQRENWGSRE